MRGIFVILARELRAYFVSPLAWAIGAGVLFMNGFAFVTLLSFLNGSPSTVGTPMELFFGGTFLFWLTMIFLGPVLPMRLLAEERRSGTLEVLLTAPLTETQVVLGKYFAALVFYILLWAPTALYAVFLDRHVDLDWGPVAAAYVGVLGIGALLLSVGLFASAFARSQVVAAVVGFALVFALIVVGLLEFLVGDGALHEILASVNLLQHMEDFARGIVDTRHLIYYVTGTGFFLFLSGRVLAGTRWR